MKDIQTYQNYIKEALAAFELPKAPENLYAPIDYFLDLGGKRMRPVLTLMGTELFDSAFKKAIPAALAVELFHNFSLIHDDIMDEAPLRRGKETVHTKWNTNIAILSGDALLIEAYKQLSHYEPVLLSKLLPLFNQTAIEVCEGQQYDMDFESMDSVEIDAYINMIRNKTAVLLGCSLKMGALIGGASENEASDLYEFGVNLGLAFQLQDDILDVYGDQSKFGKQVGGDIIANKKTFLLLKALEEANEDQTKRFEALFTEVDTNKKVNGVKALYAELNIREQAIEKMNSFYAIAMDSLDRIKQDDKVKEPLTNLAQYLLNREE